MTAIPYTYRIFHKPTKMYYYGVRYAKNCHPDDFWVSYFTSSSLVKELIKHFGKDSFEIRRIKRFETKQKAIKWEAMFLTRINAAASTNWLNKNNGNYNFAYYAKGNLHWNYGRKHSPETIEKMKKPKSEETKKKISEAMKGKKQSSSTIQKRAIKNTGQKRSPEQRQRQSASAQKRCNYHIWITNGYISMKIHKDDLETYISKGYHRGRVLIKSS